MSQSSPSIASSGSVETGSALPQKLHFPLGLIGFPQWTEFSLEVVRESPPFLLMQAVGEGAPEFVVMQPGGVLPDYELTLRDEDCEALGIQRASDATVLNIVTIRSANPQYVTVNLAGPVIVNRASGRGRQIILVNNRGYSTEHVLVDQREAGVRGDSAGAPAPEI